MKIIRDNNSNPSTRIQMTTQNKLQELGSIKDIQGNDYTVFGHAQYQLMTNDLMLTNLILISESTGDLFSVNINEMPDCFSESSITILEENIELDKMNARMDHLCELHRDRDSND